MATNSLDFKVKNGLVVSTTATIRGTTQASSTTTGALVVDGGVGIQKNLHVGGTITGELSGTASSANNLNGGNNGSIPYQNGTGTTTFLGIGNNNYVLASNGTIPTWASLSSLGAGSATTATNLAGGSAGQVPYQTGLGATAFTGPGTLGQLLVSAGTTSTGPVFTNTASIKVGSASNADNATLATSANQLTDARTITLAGDLSGNIAFDGTTNVTLTATINANSIELGTDTTGNYIASGATSGHGLSGSTNSEGAVFTVTSNATSSNTISTIVFRDVNGAFNAGALTLETNTQSTSTQTGGLITVGGVGIGGNLNLGGYLALETTSTLSIDPIGGLVAIGDDGYWGGYKLSVTSLNSTTSALAAYGYHKQGRPVATIWGDETYHVSDGNTTFAGIMFATSNGGDFHLGKKLIGTSGNYSELFVLKNGAFQDLITIDYNGNTILTNTDDSTTTNSGALVVPGGIGVAKNLYVGGKVNVTDTTDSTLTTNGSMITAGGLGIAKNLNVGNIIKTIDATQATATNTGALQVVGGAGIGKALYVGGTTTILDTTNATSTNSGALQIVGGVGINKSLYVGGTTASFVGNVNIGDVDPASSLAGPTGLVVYGTNESEIVLQNASSGKGGGSGLRLYYGYGNPRLLLKEDRNLSLGTNNEYWLTFTTSTLSTVIEKTTVATTTQTGALVVNGGVGIGEKLFVHSSGTFGGDLLPNTDGGASLGSPSRRWGTLYVTSGTIDIGGATIQATDGVLTAEKLKVIGTETSVSTLTGAMVITGGLGIGKDVWIGSSQASTTTVSQNALYVEGGAGINGSLYVNGIAVFQDDTVFLGETTYVFNTNTVYSDNILELHYHEGTSSWTVNDGQDIGIRMHFYDTENTNAFFGRAGDTGYLEWYGRGVSETTSGTIVGDYGTFKTGSIQLTHTTASNSTQTGALVVAGGVGIGGDLSLSLNKNLYFGTHGKIFDDGNFHIHSLTEGGFWLNNESGGEIRINNQYNGGVVLTNGTGVVEILSTQESSSTATGGLRVVGGVGIGKNIHIGGSITLPNENHSSFSAQVSSASPITVDTWSTSTYRTAKYIAQITQGTNYQSAELLVVHNGTDAFISEYAIIRTNTNLGTFTADVNSNNVRLRVTMNSASAATIKLSRILITV